MIIKHGTATTILIGPVVGEDGKTPYTGSILNTDIKIAKSYSGGGYGAFTSVTNTPAHIGNGFYALLLTAGECSSTTNITISSVKTNGWISFWCSFDVYAAGSYNFLYNGESFGMNVASVEGVDASEYFDGLVGTITGATTTIEGKIDSIVSDGVTANVTKIDGASLATHHAGMIPSDIVGVSNGKILPSHTIPGVLPVNLWLCNNMEIGGGSNKYKVPVDIHQVNTVALSPHAAGKIPADVLMVEGTGAIEYLNTLDDATISAVNAARDSVNNNIDSAETVIRADIATVKASADAAKVSADSAKASSANVEIGMFGKMVLVEVGSDQYRLDYYSGTTKVKSTMTNRSTNERTPL